MKNRVLQTISLVTTTVLLFCVGCSDKKEEKNPFETEKTARPTPEIPKADLTLAIEDENVSSVESDAEAFVLATTEGNLTLRMDIDGHMEKQNANNETLLCLVVARSDSLPATAQLPYLSDLVEANEGAIDCTALLLDANLSDLALETLRRDSPALRFAYGASTRRFVRTLVVDGLQYTDNYPIPLTLLYRSGKPLRRYEGVVPYEMIAHDVATILKEKGENR